MTESTREKLREEIECVYQTSLLRRYWGFVGRALARLVGKNGEAPMWISALVALGVVQVATQILLAVLKVPFAGSPLSVQKSYLFLAYIWLSIIVFQALIELFIKHLKTTLVDAVALPEGEAGIRRWQQQTGRASFETTAAIIFTLLFAFVTIFVIYFQRDVHAGFEVYFFNVLLFSQMSFHLYWMLVTVITFTSSIRHWKLNLFPDDPASSYVIQTLHQVSSTILLLVALLLGLNIVLVIPAKLYSQVYLISTIIAFWIPSLFYFWMSETSFSKLVRAAKMERLDVIQSQIIEIESTQDMKQKEPAESVQRLLDLHDRVKAAPVSIINLNSIANLLGSLALPLLAFLINVFDIWQKLFQTP